MLSTCEAATGYAHARQRSGARSEHIRPRPQIGANIGEFTSRCLNVFPKAKFLMIEPTPKHEKALADIRPDRTMLQMGLLGDRNGDVEMFVHQRDKRGTGNSLYYETAANAGDFMPEKVPLHGPSHPIPSHPIPSHPMPEKVPLHVPSLLTAVCLPLFCP